VAWLNLLLKGKRVAGAIKSVAPKLTKGESTAVKLHKLKAKIKKGSDDAEDAIRTGVKKFKTSIDKMKDPK
jgi:uncharacterized protein YjbJ (UPF0337 family)|tara:strand:+ start:306 stop:518 length:213 start_codon:yes stop_codon:yes gene_type:complete